MFSYLRFFAVFVFLAFISLNLPSGSVAQQAADFSLDGSTYYRVTIPLDRPGLRQEMADMGLAVDHAHLHDGDLHTELSGRELQMLQDDGIAFKIEQADMQAWYEQQIMADPVFQSKDLSSFKNTTSLPDNFHLGSMGGFLTFEEVVQELDEMHEIYPDIITEKFSIGESFEGRDIWTVWIGTEMDEDKPQAYYNSLIHAREPMSMTNLVYYMWWLLENYETNELASFLISERHMAFTLVINPDGYEYNRQNNPNGGGMHRKNRRPVGTSNQGVDLNRNFGPEFFWDHPNGGSSLNSNSDTYRGAAPFSEPETAAMRDFVRENSFRTVFNYHSFSNLLIYPYGVLQRETKDANVFTPYAIDMTEENNYEYGIDVETVGYSTRGAADDWFYGPEIGNPNGRIPAISFTPEVGSFSDYFWPSSSRIVPLSEDNLLANQLLALYAGPELRTDSDQAPEISTLEAAINAETAFHLSFAGLEYYNYGRSDMEVTLTASSDSEAINWIQDSVEFTIGLDETFSGIAGDFVLEVDGFTERDEEINITVEMEAPYMQQSRSWEYTLTTVGSPVSTEPEDELPQSITLEQNYPNPFNPSTSISFALPEARNVSLEVYDSMGRKLQTLTRERMSAGEHSIQFSGENLSSGIYFYRLQAGDEVRVRKMTLVK